MTLPVPALSSVLLLVASLVSQTAQVLPVAAATADQSSSTSSPLFRNAAERVLYVWDSSHWTDAAIGAPIEIQRLRLRADGAAGTWAGTTMANLRIEMSHGVLDHAAASPILDANHGADRTVVYDGPVTILPGSNPGGGVGSDLVDLLLATPFVFDPARGDDLVIDYVTSGLATTAGSYPLDADDTAAGRVGRVEAASPGAPNGTVSFSAHAMELEFAAAQGAFAAFSVDRRSGPSPLAVQFTDRSSTTDPGGIVSWEWDFDDDGVVDSTVQNPLFTYSGCGEFSPRLTVTTAQESADLLRSDWIRTDDVVAEFDVDVRSGAAPLAVQFTDLSQGAPLTWEWDFDDDGVVDSTAQNPSFVFGLGDHTVSLTVTRNCRSSTETKVGFVVGSRSLSSLFLANNGINPPGGVFFDVTVQRPEGLVVEAMDLHCRENAGTPFDVEIYLTSQSYAGKDDDESQWRLVATGTSVSEGLGVPSFSDVTDFFLPVGRYGMAIYMPNARQRYTNGTGQNQSFSNADLTLDLGVAREHRFSGTQYAPRVWNGTIYYQYDAEDIYSFFGEGCAGGGPTTQLSRAPGSQLRVGQRFEVDVAPLPPGGFGGFMILGLSNSSWQGLPLPLDLAAFRLPGCFGRVDVFSSTIIFDGGGGSARWGLNIPLDPTLVGVRIYNQALVSDQNSGRPRRAVMTDAAAGIIGG